MFIVKVSDMQVSVAEVDTNRLDTDKVDAEKLRYTCVVYLSGPLYFGTCNKLEEKITALGENYNVIFSMRGVNIADVSGIEALREYCEKMVSQGKMIYFSCVNKDCYDHGGALRIQGAFQVRYVFLEHRQGFRAHFGTVIVIYVSLYCK